MVGEGCPGHGPTHLLSASAAEIGFQWDPHALAWIRPGVADAHDAADVFLYRDSSIAPLLMRRRFKAVMDVLGAMIRHGVCLLLGRSSSLLSGTGSLLLDLCILLLLVVSMLFGVWYW